MFYSRSTCGFYSNGINDDNMPADVVELTGAEYHNLLAGQAAGKEIVVNEEGFPELRDPLPIDAKIAAQRDISRLEAEQMLPRVAREFMLLSMQNTFAPAQLAAHPGYQKLKAFDSQIAALRALL
jgi:hypothetical protein